MLAPIASATLDLDPQQELYSLSAGNLSSGQAHLKFCVQKAKSLESQKAEKVNELRAEAAATAPDSLEEARAAVREALENAALDGRLQKALSENQDSPALPLRAQIENAVPSMEPLLEELRELQAEQKERKEQLAHLIELKKLKREQRLLEEEQRLLHEQNKLMKQKLRLGHEEHGQLTESTASPSKLPSDRPPRHPGSTQVGESAPLLAIPRVSPGDALASPARSSVSAAATPLASSSFSKEGLAPPPSIEIQDEALRSRSSAELRSKRQQDLQELGCSRPSSAARPISVATRQRKTRQALEKLAKVDVLLSNSLSAPDLRTGMHVSSETVAEMALGSGHGQEDGPRPQPPSSPMTSLLSPLPPRENPAVPSATFTSAGARHRVAPQRGRSQIKASPDGLGRDVAEARFSDAKIRFGELPKLHPRPEEKGKSLQEFRIRRDLGKVLSFNKRDPSPAASLRSASASKSTIAAHW